MNRCVIWIFAILLTSARAGDKSEREFQWIRLKPFSWVCIFRFNSFVAPIIHSFVYNNGCSFYAVFKPKDLKPNKSIIRQGTEMKTKSIFHPFYIRPSELKTIQFIHTHTKRMFSLKEFWLDQEEVRHMFNIQSMGSIEWIMHSLRWILLANICGWRFKFESFLVSKFLTIFCFDSFFFRQQFWFISDSMQTNKSPK